MRHWRTSYCLTFLLVALPAVPAWARPRANAGPNQRVLERSVVALNGTRSREIGGPEGVFIISYLWRQLSGPLVLLSSNNSPIVTFTAPSVQTNVTLRFALTVIDTLGASNTATTSVVVLNADGTTPPPIADPGPNQNAPSGGVVKLDGSHSSDPSGGPLIYRWDQIGGQVVAVQNSTSAIASFQAPTVPSPTVLQFRLTVTGAGGSSSATVAITVLPPPTPAPAPVPQDFHASVDAFSIYPNPYDPKTGSVHLQYTLGADSDVTLTIVDLFGRSVRELNFGRGAAGGARGLNHPSWDGRNGAGDIVGNGGYIVQVRAVDGAGRSATASGRLAVVR